MTIAKKAPAKKAPAKKAPAKKATVAEIPPPEGMSPEARAYGIEQGLIPSPAVRVEMDVPAADPVGDNVSPPVTPSDQIARLLDLSSRTV